MIRLGLEVAAELIVFLFVLFAFMAFIVVAGAAVS